MVAPIEEWPELPEGQLFAGWDLGVDGCWLLPVGLVGWFQLVGWLVRCDKGEESVEIDRRWHDLFWSSLRVGGWFVVMIPAPCSPTGFTISFTISHMSFPSTWHYHFFKNENTWVVTNNENPANWITPGFCFIPEPSDGWLFWNARCQTSRGRIFRRRGMLAGRVNFWGRPKRISDEGFYGVYIYIESTNIFGFENTTTSTNTTYL